MTDTKRDVAWRKYVSTCQLGGTREQRLWAFRAWLALEQKDMAAERARVRRAQKASASS